MSAKENVTHVGKLVCLWVTLVIGIAGQPDSSAGAGSSWSDDFENGVSDASLWSWGGFRRGVDTGNWQWSHQEVVATDGYLLMRVWGPVSGNSFGGEAWLRTLFNYNDGADHRIDFRWSADVNAYHVDMFAIQITDGTLPEVPGGNDIFWFGAGGGPIDGPSWKNLYFRYTQPDLAPTDWSIFINATNKTATLFSAPNQTGVILNSISLPADQAWHLRFIHADGTSSGFPAGDNTLSSSFALFGDHFS